MLHGYSHLVNFLSPFKRCIVFLEVRNRHDIPVAKSKTTKLYPRFLYDRSMPLILMDPIPQPVIPGSLHPSLTMSTLTRTRKY